MKKLRLTIVPKDTTDRVVLDDVFTWQEFELYCVRLSDGTIRKYPMRNIWYVQLDYRDA